MFRRLTKLAHCSRPNKFLLPRFYVTVTADDNEVELDKSQLLVDLNRKYQHNISEISDIIKKNVGLEKKTHISQWDTCFEVLQKFGYSFEEIIRMISKFPGILDIRNINQVMERWYTMEINSDYIQLIFLHRPELLGVPIDNLIKRMPYLKSLAHKDKRLASLLVNCPNVLTDTWLSVLRKIEYIEKEMRIEKSEVVTCMCLSKSLEHIKTRHILLYRLGIYVKPPLHKKEKKTINRNPPLKRIVDNEDISFCKRVAKITLEELEVFKEIYKEEMANFEEEMELDSGSDSDSE